MISVVENLVVILYLMLDWLWNDEFTIFDFTVIHIIRELSINYPSLHLTYSVVHMSATSYYIRV